MAFARLGCCPGVDSPPRFHTALPCVAPAVLARACAFLRALHCLRWHSHFHSLLVAVLALQRALWIASAPCICRRLRDSRLDDSAFRFVEPSSPPRLYCRRVRSDRRQLRERLARHSDLPEGSSGQHAHAQSTAGRTRSTAE